MERYVLGIDVDTSGTRALIANSSGRLVASATEEHAPFDLPQTGWAEQHLSHWWR
jgi:xylulokinase